MAVGPEDYHWMRHALTLAQRASALEEVPVGALVVRAGRILGEGWNHPVGACDPTAHAEIMALRQAAAAAGNYRLPDTTLYVTLEPCPMCVGALVHARVGRLVFGAYDPRTGAVESCITLLEAPSHNHRVAYEGGVMAADCGRVLRRFFQDRR